MEFEEELEDFKEEQRLVEATRQRIARRIALESEELIDSLFEMANDPEEDSKVRLSAINTLLERSLPKLGVEHAERTETEESSGSKSIRSEIEALLRGEEE